MTPKCRHPTSDTQHNLLTEGIPIGGALFYGDGKARTDKQEQDRKQQALEDGVQCLLRNSIVTDYNKYTNKGYCPIYAKETLKKTYQAYSNRGGNDVAKELYHKLLQMPSEVENG